MPSPFPGMDPYVERPNIWTDLHDDLAGELRAMLNAVLQPKYYASLTPFVTYDVIDSSAVNPTRPFVVSPDVAVWETSPDPVAGETAPASSHRCRKNRWLSPASARSNCVQIRMKTPYD